MRKRAVRALVTATLVIAASGASTSVATASVWPADDTTAQTPYATMTAFVQAGNSSDPSKWTFSVWDTVFRFDTSISVSFCQVRVTIWYNRVAQKRTVVPCAPFSHLTSDTLLTYTIPRPPKGTFVEAKTAVEGWIYGSFYSSGNAYIFHTTQS